MLYAGGAVATAAGLHTVLAGARSLPRQRLANHVVESELRFYAAFYVAYGAAMLSPATRAGGLAGAKRPNVGPRSIEWRLPQPMAE